MQNNSEKIRLWLEFPVLRKQYEVNLPTSRSLNDCIPYLNEMFAGEFSGVYVIEDGTMFFEASSSCLISRAVTLSNQNLRDGMRVSVY